MWFGINVFDDLDDDLCVFVGKVGEVMDIVSKKRIDFVFVYGGFMVYKVVGFFWDLFFMCMIKWFKIILFDVILNDNGCLMMLDCCFYFLVNWFVVIFGINFFVL